MSMNIGADIASYVKQIEQQANMVARDANLMAALVSGFNDTSGTAIRARSDYGTATFTQIADSDDLTSQVFSPSVSQQLTPYEFGAQFFMTDTRRRNDPFNYAVEAQQELGMALAQKVEVDLLGAFSSFTAGTILSASNMTWSNLLAAYSVLRNQNPGGEVYAVMHPYQYHSLGTAIAPGAGVNMTNAPALQDALIRNFYVGSYAGMQIFVTSNIASGTGCKAGVFTREAIALDVRVPFSIEPERDASRRGIELNATSTYATGVWRPKFGVLLQTAGTAPTG